MNVYVALLRGINVGGSNLIRMPALKACFEAERLQDVATYIQSGNVLFTADRSSQQALTARIEKALSRTFAYEARVVVRSFEQMRRVVQGAPKGFGTQPGVHRYDVIFLKHPLTADEALQSVTAKPGVDRVYAGEDVLYFSRLIAKATQSQLSRIVGKPAYQSMTIRNWNTTRKLLQLMEGMGVGTARGCQLAPAPVPSTASPQRGPCAVPPRCGADRTLAYPAGCATPPSTGPHPRRRSRTDRSAW